MADNFDAVDIMQDILGTALSGAPVFKDRAPTDQAGYHVVIRSNANNSLEVVNVAQVNVNIYVPRWKNGMVDRFNLKTIRTLVNTKVNNASSPAGYYCVIDRAFSTLLEDVKKDFDCFTIRYEITLNR